MFCDFGLGASHFLEIVDTFLEGQGEVFDGFGDHIERLLGHIWKETTIEQLVENLIIVRNDRKG